MSAATPGAARVSFVVRPGEGGDVILTKLIVALVAAGLSAEASRLAETVAGRPLSDAEAASFAAIAAAIKGEGDA